MTTVPVFREEIRETGTRPRGFDALSSVRPRPTPAQGGSEAAVSLTRLSKFDRSGHQGDATMRTFGKSVLAFGLLAAMAAPAWAQGGRGFGGGFGGGGM